MVDPFGWHQLSLDELHRIRERLSRFETMTWAEILIEGKKQHHSIPVANLEKAAQDRLDAARIFQDELVSLHVTGRERIWGYRVEDGIFVLLWWDPQHAVCKSVRKHT